MTHAKPSLDARPCSPWRLAFVPVDDAVPAECRVRNLLKRALRSHGLRCIDLAAPVPIRCHDGIRLAANAYRQRGTR